MSEPAPARRFKVQKVDDVTVAFFLAKPVVDEEDIEGAAIGTAALPPVVRAWLAAATFPTGAALALMPWSIEIR